MALFIAAAGVVRFLLPGHGAIPKGEIPPGLGLLFEALQVILILGHTAVMAHIEGRTIWSYGLAGPAPIRRAVTGWLAGFAHLLVSHALGDPASAAARMAPKAEFSAAPSCCSA